MANKLDAPTKPRKEIFVHISGQPIIDKNTTDRLEYLINSYFIAQDVKTGRLGEGGGVAFSYAKLDDPHYKFVVKVEIDRKKLGIKTSPQFGENLDAITTLRNAFYNQETRMDTAVKDGNNAVASPVLVDHQDQNKGSKLVLTIDATDTKALTELFEGAQKEALDKMAKAAQSSKSR